MTAPGSRAVVSKEDVEQAQAVIEAWQEEWPTLTEAIGGSLPFMRGLITQAIADAHADGYDQGVVRGRRMIANTIKDALDGEGL